MRLSQTIKLQSENSYCRSKAKSSSQVLTMFCPRAMSFLKSSMHWAAMSVWSRQSTSDQSARPYTVEHAGDEIDDLSPRNQCVYENLRRSAALTRYNKSERCAQVLRLLHHGLSPASA